MHLDHLIPQLQLRRGDQYESTVNHPNAKHDTRKEAIDVKTAPMEEKQSAWTRRMASERKVRGWSQTEAVRAMHAHAPGELPEDASLLRQWKRWESGQTMPSEFYQPIIAKTFGTVTHAMFPVPPQRDTNAEIVAASGMDTLELVARLQRSDLDDATLNAVRVMADTLCSEYASRPADDLLTEGGPGCDGSPSIRGSG